MKMPKVPCPYCNQVLDARNRRAHVRSHHPGKPVPPHARDERANMAASPEPSAAATRESVDLPQPVIHEPVDMVRGALEELRRRKAAIEAKLRQAEQLESELAGIESQIGSLDQALASFEGRRAPAETQPVIQHVGAHAHASGKETTE